MDYIVTISAEEYRKLVEGVTRLGILNRRNLEEKAETERKFYKVLGELRDTRTELKDTEAELEELNRLLEGTRENILWWKAKARELGYAGDAPGEVQ